MSKFTNILLVLIVTPIIVCFFSGSSCDDGVSPKKKGSIVGAWEMESIVMYGTPVGKLNLTAEQFLAMSGTGAKESLLQFNEDGTASVTTTYTDESQDEIDGTWIADGDSLTVEGAGIDDTVTFDVDGNTLTLTRTMPIDFDADGVAEDTEIDMVYTRI